MYMTQHTSAHYLLRHAASRLAKGSGSWGLYDDDDDGAVVVVAPKPIPPTPMPITGRGPIGIPPIGDIIGMGPPLPPPRGVVVEGPEGTTKPQPGMPFAGCSFIV